MKINLLGFMFVLALFFTMTAYAGSPGANSLNFLKLGISARQSSMGGSGIAFSEDAEMVHLNPATLSQLKHQKVNFSFHKMFEDISLGYVNYARNTDNKGNFGVSIQYLTYGAIQGTNSAGLFTNDIDASDKMFCLSWAPSKEVFAPGINIKVAQEKLDSTVATAYVIDTGIFYRPHYNYKGNSFFIKQFNHLSFGAALRNLSTGAKFEEKTEKLPLIAAVGLAHRSLADALTFTVDLEHLSGRDSIVLKTGMEAWLKDIMAFRAGYRADRDIGPGFTVGLGFKEKSARLDYALELFGDFGNYHHIEISFRFGMSKVDKYYKQGVSQMRKGNYADAILIFDKALALDSKDKRVIKKAMEAAKVFKKNK